MVGTVATLENILEQEPLAKSLVYMYTDWKTQRDPWEKQCLETRNYLFATDTSALSNSGAGWSNTTHMPKLTQIRDNLHANYMVALFPTEDWLQWESADSSDENLAKKLAIEAYMRNKLREQGFYETVSNLVYDYIDMGNCIADVEYIAKSTELEDGEVVPGYIGPRAIRDNPFDVVFNPTAAHFTDSPKITRRLIQFGELLKMVDDNPEDSSWAKEAVEKAKNRRSELTGPFNENDFEKAEAYRVDGFGSLLQYYQSGYCELLEFEGDIYDPVSGVLEKNMLVTVMDRQCIVRKQTNPSWFGASCKQHVAWRKRPDNLLGMGPLDNLVGMQFRLNQLENAKADTIDMNIAPMMIIRGEAPEDIKWGPYEKVFLDENSNVELRSPDLGVLAVDNEIQWLMDKMEEFAGAPREALGIRSPGEKTAFEVQSLQTAATRIFQRKVINFEVNLLEPLLNTMLEVARRNLDVSDQVRVQDDDTGVISFMEITKEDLTAKGKLYPIGARHFSEKASAMQTMIQLSNTNIWPKIEKHLSDKKLAKFVEDQTGFERFGLYSENIGIEEQMETQQLIQGLQEEAAVQEAVPVEDV